MFLKKVALVSTIAVMAGSAATACEISARVSIVGNEFPAIQTVGLELKNVAAQRSRPTLRASIKA